ncbi:MAG: dTDP-4-dehydrorhamnose reductase [Nitrospinaceae bacterium]|jgi:dTDP-4-dehydrorhamnose reductase|nr:dTDP-4-dehydrorhamnose reductase [Nitrospinaceae bacterium]MDP7058672.1 dTDP-4-dehydrorhamnose reductase [Nitrospinaceae bacterium]HAK36951.1 dTDP-4-dehydrorhamnose reductase [Nitrospina sp.]|tara:strand:+ start:1729 stop:2616 length:888 start_codon:yes stop_codon:yes gene_type:complete
MRILLTGKNGQVGGELEKVLTPFGEVTATGRNEMDLSDPNQIRRTIRQISPELIINAAAYTAVDKAESEPELALAVNGTAPGILAEETKKLGAVLIHYSTDYAYSGKMRSDPYIESDFPAPISVYGKTKFEGDQAVERSGVPYLIFRTSWVYSMGGNNFLKTILRLVKERDELRIVDDQLGTPTWCRSIADATGSIIRQLIDKGGHSLSNTVSDISGVYHMSCGGQTNWHGFARAIIDLTSPDPMPRLVAIPSSDYPTPAARPAYSVLSNAKLEKTFGAGLPHWEEALKQCLNKS